MTKVNGCEILYSLAAFNLYNVLNNGANIYSFISTRKIPFSWVPVDNTKRKLNRKCCQFWRNFHHWMHQKWSVWQLSVQLVLTISSKWRHFRVSGWVCQGRHKAGISDGIYVITSIPALISNHMPSKVWDEINYQSPNFYGATFEVWK